MQAISCARYGPPEVLQLREVATPTPADDEVRIRVRAAEATKADVELRRFRFAVKWFWLPLRIAFGIRRPRRPILGGYFSGEIDAVGAAVTDFAPGDAVYGSAGLRLGAYGEFLTLPARYPIATKPDTMTFAQAAAVPLGGLNALHFMRLAKIRPGDSVLINGAGGSIGAHAVQIARSMGGTVTAVDRAAKARGLRRLGADRFVDYTREDFTTGTADYNVIFDMVAGSDVAACIRKLRPGGRYVSGNPRLSCMLRCVLTTWLTDKTARFAFAPETADDLLTLKAMIEDGRIGPIVDRVLPMHEAAQAHRLVESEQRCGAIVLAIGSDGQ